MFGPFRKKPQGTTLELQIDGMHCTSCSMNIDGELEDNPGVLSASTSYAKGKTVVEYDASVTSKEKVSEVIEGLGYKVGK